MPLQTYTYRRIKYFVDYRLQQFRSDTPVICFYEFKSPEGDRILAKMIREDVVEIGRLVL